MSMKNCSKCNQLKPIIEFGKHKQKPDGLSSWCKLCKKEQDQLFYNKNKDKKKNIAKQYYNKNKEKVLERKNAKKEYYHEYNKKWHQENRDYVLSRLKEYRDTHVEERKLYKKKYREENKELIREQYKAWLNEKPIRKIAKSCRNRLREFIKGNGFTKYKSFSDYIGCTQEELKLYIESKFQEGMTWENYGNWHLDHVVPLSSAKTEEQLYKLCHYTNLQPLLAEENLKKNCKLEYKVREIKPVETHPFLLEIHYAKRLPMICFSYGLFANDELVGVITYGRTSSPGTAKALVGENEKNRVYELNRLCLKNNLKNEASILISKSLKLLPKGLIILSFADSSQNHVGYVYQATNFKYYGKTLAKNEIALKSSPSTHSLSIYDQSKNQTDRIGYLKEKYGDDLYWRKRSIKHRYVYITGNDKSLLNLINYKQLPYPKKNI